MSEMMGVNVLVKVRPEWIDNEAHRTNHSDGTYSQWNDVSFTDAAPPVLHDLAHELEVMDYVDDLVTLQGDLNYGFPSGAQYDVELREAGIPFIGSTDAKYEFDGDTSWWMPGMDTIDGRQSGNGGVTLISHEWEELKKEHIVDAPELRDYLDRLIALRDAIDAHFVDALALLRAAPLPPSYEPKED